MDAIAIRCEGIGKRYRIGQRQPYQTLRESLASAWRAPFRKSREAEFLWALRDISVEVRRGEVLGVIGRNGSGKSTLLKILSRITKPSQGRAEIRGRVGALLEVGTGFHPELTGRENIYLNGAVLGMSKREIEGKFEEVVEFSECARFLDMPVKHYSSGMYMRLAFSVAAHLETDILFVDEVLAVGDAAFQKKCLGKMGDAAHQGRTILFVSHNLIAVESFCARAICLHEGRIVLEGPSAEVTSRYLQNWIPASSEVIYSSMESAPGNDVFRFRRARVSPVDGGPSELIAVRTRFVVEFEYWKLDSQVSLDIGVYLYNQQGLMLFETGYYGAPPAPAGLIRSWFEVPGDLLNNGTYRIELAIFPRSGDGKIFHREDMLVFEVHDDTDAASESRDLYCGPWGGVVRPYLEWKNEQLTTDLVDS